MTSENAKRKEMNGDIEYKARTHLKPISTVFPPFLMRVSIYRQGYRCRRKA